MPLAFISAFVSPISDWVTSGPDTGSWNRTYVRKDLFSADQLADPTPQGSTMAEQQEPVRDATINDLIDDPAFQEVVAALVDRRAGEIRAHHAELLEAAGHVEAAEFLRNVDE